jgi:hypothetical protein
MADLEAAYFTVINTFYPIVSTPIYVDVEWLEEYVFFVQFLSLSLGVFATYLTYKSTTPDKEIQLEGRKLIEGEEAIDKWFEVMDKEESWGGEGILICETPNGDQLTISEDRETKHTIIMGGTGAGKTTIFGLALTLRVQDLIYA